MASRKHAAPSYLTKLSVDELRVELMRLLCESYGSVPKTAGVAGCSIATFWRMVNKAGMNETPAQIRDRVYSRFRLPPLDEESLRNLRGITVSDGLSEAPDGGDDRPQS